MTAGWGDRQNGPKRAGWWDFALCLVAFAVGDLGTAAVLRLVFHVPQVGPWLLIYLLVCTPVAWLCLGMCVRQLDVWDERRQTKEAAPTPKG